MDKEVSVGEMIKIARVERGLSKWQLADKMGLSREYITDVEYGEAEIDNVTFDEFKKALGIRRREELV